MDNTIQPALESVKDPKKKRAIIEDKVLKIMSMIDPAGDNTKRWKDRFAKMSDSDFNKFMQHLKNKECAIDIIVPNMKKVLKISDLIKSAESVGLTLAHRLWLPDKVTGRKYLTNEKYLVLSLPIRRAQQEWDKKLSVPSRDKTIDSLTGQVIGDDKACSLSAPEIQALGVRGLTSTMIELCRVRGGDVNAYGEFKRQMQETGTVSLDTLDPSTRVRSADIAKVLLRGMMIDSNI